MQEFSLLMKSDKATNFNEAIKQMFKLAHINNIDTNSLKKRLKKEYNLDIDASKVSIDQTQEM